jgi:hypothetical protein
MVPKRSFLVPLGAKVPLSAGLFGVAIAQRFADFG